MKKIIVDKNEGVAEVIDRVLGESDNEISIVVPKGSALGRSVSNFHLLKREADSARRTIVVESVDETILAFAKESGIEASHPLWKGVRGSGGFSDIVPRRDVDEPAEEKRAEPKRGKKAEPVVEKKATFEDNDEEDKDEDDDMEEPVEDDDEDEKEEKRPRSSTTLRSRFFDGTPDLDEDDDDDGRPRRGGRVIGWIVGILVVCALAAWLVSAFFNHADITINFKQLPWSYQDSFTADKNAVAINSSSNTIPAQIFTTNKNITETFHGSSVQQVSQKAQGTITIYNAYSAAPQDLVATTRFETPDGKIFRITTNVTVP